MLLNKGASGSGGVAGWRNLAATPKARVRLSRIDELGQRCLGRRLSHLTPRYVLDRCLVAAYERRHPDAPWLTAGAISILSSALRKMDNGLEYGSGRSTLWFAKRTNSLISLETSRAWYEQIAKTLGEQGVTNVRYKYILVDPRLTDDPHHAEYVEADPGLAKQSLDYALVDGMYRDECALRAADLLKPGGILIVDNANWFIPYPTRSPTSASEFAGPLWREFLERVQAWRLIWTSNGVSDTALWFKTA